MNMGVLIREYVSVELSANLVNKARKAGVDVEAVCRTAIATAIGLKSNWTAMQRASRDVMDKIAGQSNSEPSRLIGLVTWR